MNSTISNALLCCSLFQGLTIQDISNVLQKCHPKTKTLHRQDAYYLSGDIYRNVDIVIFGENENWLVDHYESKATNSPFTGWTLPGKVHYTICNGKIVYELS